MWYLSVNVSLYFSLERLYNCLFMNSCLFIFTLYVPKYMLFPPLMFAYIPSFSLSCALLTGFCPGLIWTRTIAGFSFNPTRFMEVSLFQEAAVAEREPGLQPQAAENEKGKEAERSGEGKSCNQPPASHPLRFYWLPLKHLQLDQVGKALGLHSPLSTFRTP